MVILIMLTYKIRITTDTNNAATWLHECDPLPICDMSAHGKFDYFDQLYLYTNKGITKDYLLVLSVGLAQAKTKLRYGMMRF